jgi:DNA-binding FadR family transcriptional regulator
VDPASTRNISLDRPVHRTSAYAFVVDRIRRAIHLGVYLPDEPLPSERELAKQFEVSRVTAREALRVLEGEGYLRSRPGTRRPVVQIQVRGPEELQLELRARFREFEDILDFRVANERAAASLAAQRRTDDELSALMVSVEEMRASTSLAEFRRADSRFHLLVADASRNRLIRDAVEDARAAMFLPIDALDFEFVLPTSLRGHMRVFQAIRGQDATKAGRAMADHIEVTRRELRSVLAVGAGARP